MEMASLLLPALHLQKSGIFQDGINLMIHVADIHGQVLLLSK